MSVLRERQQCSTSSSRKILEMDKKNISALCSSDDQNTDVCERLSNSSENENGWELPPIKHEAKPAGKFKTRRKVKLPKGSLPSLPTVDIVDSYITGFRKAMAQKEELVKAAMCNASNDAPAAKVEKQKSKVTRKTQQAQKQSSPKQDDEIDEEEKDEEEKDDEEIIDEEISQSLESKRKLLQIKRKIDKERQWNKRLCEFTMPLEESSDDDVKVFVKDQCPVIVKIRCKGQISRFSMDRKETFMKVVKQLSEQHKAVPSSIKLFLDEHTISLNETPEELNLSATDIIDCYVLNSDAEVTSFDDETWITVKFQSSRARLTSHYKVHKLDPFLIAMEKYSQEHSIPLEKMLFLFDGEKINSNENAVELELEDGSVVDVRIAKN